MIVPILLLAAQSDSISIPIATYSYAEIAQRLSTPDEVVTAAKAVAGRGALVGLHGRSRAEVLEIICKGLDLQAVKSSPGQLKLEAREDVERRDKRWRASLVTLMSDAWKRRQADFAELADQDPSQVQTRIKDLLSGPNRRDSRMWVDLQMFAQNRPLAIAAVTLAGSCPTELPPQFLEFRTKRDQPSKPLPSALADQVRKAMSGYGGVGNPVVLMRTLERGAGQLMVTTGVFPSNSKGQLVWMPTPGSQLVIAGGRSTEQQRFLVDDVFQGDSKLKTGGLGADAVDWLKLSKENTEVELRRDGLDTPIEFPVFENSLSGLFERWSKKTGQDVVMELAPIAESVMPINTLMSATQSRSSSIRQALSHDDQWGLDSTGGVLVVRDRLAFLDRVSGCPTGLIAQCARHNLGRSGAVLGMLPDVADRGPGLPMIEDLLPIVKLRAGWDPNSAEWFDRSSYRGLSDIYLRSHGFFLWPGLPNGVMRQIRASDHGSVSTPVAQCGASSIENLVASFTTPDTSEEMRQHIQSQLANASVHVDWKRRPEGETRILIYLDGIEDGGMNTNVASAFRVRL